MLRHKVLSLAIAFALFFPVLAMACPYCDYSPNGWGFCKYGGYAGPYDCVTIVVDPFNGRTGCSTCGYCNWNDPNGSQGCNAGGDEDCGLSTPCDQTSLDHRGSPAGSCSGRVAGNGPSWIGARADQIVIF
jgi:hypothetical protein